MSQQRKSQIVPDTLLSILSEKAKGLDHIAIAVPDLESAITFYHEILGFEVLERRITNGRRTAMTSAVLRCGKLTFVLVQGTSPESQVSRYIDHYGAGVQHIAIEVEDLPEVVERLGDAGLKFDTSIIQGEGIRQAFTHRDATSGMMYELIEYQSPDGHFTDASVQQLFEELEASENY